MLAATEGRPRSLLVRGAASPPVPNARSRRPRQKYTAAFERCLVCDLLNCSCHHLITCPRCLMYCTKPCWHERSIFSRQGASSFCFVRRLVRSGQNNHQAHFGQVLGTARASLLNTLCRRIDGLVECRLLAGRGRLDRPLSLLHCTFPVPSEEHPVEPRVFSVATEDRKSVV